MTRNGFQALPKRDNAIVRLICFPYGGSSGNVFRTWSKSLPETIEIVAFTLPGRGGRMDEKNVTDWMSLIDEVEKDFLNLTDKPYFLLGHSLGVCIAFNLIQRFQIKNKRLPQQFFVSACKPPHIPAFHSPIHYLPQNEFFNAISKMNGIPDIIQKDNDLMKMFEPVLRADFLLAETWLYSFSEKTTIPIKVFSGLSDEIAPSEKVQEWEKYTTDFDHHSFQGDHFFLHSNEKALLKLLNIIIHPYLNESQTMAQKLLENINDTKTPYPENKTIAMLFEEQVIKNPDAIALVYQDEVMTYETLNQRANQLAHYLIKKGVKTNTLVGLCLDRSFEMIIAILSILKAGGTYFPLDNSYPEERLKFMLSDANVSIILNSIFLNKAQEEINKESGENPISNANIDSLAYVNYTSGSTGLPKGVETRQRGVVRLVCGADYVHFDNTRIFLQLAPISFDAATFEIWGALLQGGQCVLFPEKHITLKKLQTVIEKNKITTAFFTTALFNLIIDENPKILSTLKQILTGGEAHSVIHMRRALKELPTIDITSVYGPTESTTFATYYPVKLLHQNDLRIPIGRPINNTEVYIIEDELYIGGAGLAKGYLNRPAETLDKFKNNLYKTGDKVNYLNNGNLDFIGRTDNQVKIQGFRIELGEIEAALHMHHGIRQAVVIVYDQSYDNKKLIAYLVSNVNAPKPDQKELLLYLKKQLPHYMIPADFLWLDALPLTPNGKINRKELMSMQKQ